MATDRIQQILGSEFSKVSVDANTFLKINLNGDQQLLPPDIINKIVNVGEVFDNERQRSPFYRIIGSINPTISNTLFNLDDSQYADLYTWKGFNYKNSNGEYRFNSPLYSENIRNYLKEKDGWFGNYDPDSSKIGFCNYYDMEPKRERFSFVSDVSPFHAPSSNPVKNWDLVITYPVTIDDTHPMINGGLLIAEAISAVVSTRIMTAFGMPCLHNLNVGDIVKITGTTGYDGEHVVVRLGLDNGDLAAYYFVVDISPIGTISGNSRIKKVFGGIESKYYFRKFRKIQTKSGSEIYVDDYETYKLAFSENVYRDDIFQFSFNEDISISGLTDNLGRPLSELYLTIIKTDSNGLFTNVSSGIETPFISTLNKSNIQPYILNIPAINKIHNGGLLPFKSNIPLEMNVDIALQDFYGDLVEYNENEVKETILAEVSHRFNTLNRQTNSPISYVISEANQLTNTTQTKASINLGPRQEGYFYKAHHLIRIREFSSYVEQGDKNTVGIPSYAINLGDGRYLWRDMLNIGTNQIDSNALDYPFLNGCHYMYDNYIFNVRRQDPFNDWGLYYSKFPADPIGEQITDIFNSNTPEDDC